MVTSNVDLVDDSCVCNDILPVCKDVATFALRYSVCGFSRLSLPLVFVLKHGIHYFVLPGFYHSTKSHFLLQTQMCPLPFP